MDIFDVIAPDAQEPEKELEIDAETSDEIKVQLKELQKKIAEKERKRAELNKKLTAEIKDLIKAEVAKVRIEQKVVERVIEKKVIEPVHIEPRVIQAPPAPPPPPQIIREVRVEVQREKSDGKKYAEASAIQPLQSRINDLQKELEKVKATAESPLIMPGGSGVIGIPPPEPHEGKILSVVNGKANWSKPETIYLGDEWRITVSSTGMTFEHLDSGTWTEKGAWTV